MITREIRHAHFFCGLGGGAKGFNAARVAIPHMQGKFRCIGGIDVDPAGIRDFGRLSGTPGTVLDMFDLEQYLAFHGNMPPPGWREAVAADIHRAFNNERPHIVFLSAPCKGFSGLLSNSRSLTDKYQALNRLTLRGVWLMLEAYKDDPVELVVFENVPRIATRGRRFLDQITALFRAYGYAVRETTHDCGELGGLPQSRKRFLLVARHMEKVPPFLYEPERKPLRAVGDVLGRMALPGDLRAGPMHRVPALQWKTWVRLAFVEAGGDWRSLNKLAVENGHLRDYLITPAMHHGVLGVNPWGDSMGVVPGRSGPLNGNYSVADPRCADTKHNNCFRVVKWDHAAGTVTGGGHPSAGGQALADPRMNWGADAHQAKLHVTDWGQAHQAVTGARGPYSGATVVADPRQAGELFSKYSVTAYRDPAGTVISGSTTGQGAYAVADPRASSGYGGKGKYILNGFDQPANTVIASSSTGQGAFAVADPRPAKQRGKGDAYLTNGHYGVVPWDGPSGAVSAAACHDNGGFSVADPRGMPALGDKLVCRIEAMDGTWHRPFTTLELAALQSLVQPEEKLELDGLSDQAWRERIGNAVPPDAAQAIAEVMGHTLLAAWSGESFSLSAQPIWVRDTAVAISVAGRL